MISWCDGVSAYVLQAGIATVDGAGRPAEALTISVDSAQAPGVRLVPDASLAIQPDSYPVRENSFGTSFNQNDVTIGALAPLVYGRPGNDAKGLYSGTGIGGPATPAYLGEYVAGAVDMGAGTVEIAQGTIAATKVRLHDVSAGYSRTGWDVDVLDVTYQTDLLGRSRTVVFLGEIGEGFDATEIRGLPDSEYWVEWTEAYGGGVLDPMTGEAMRSADRVLSDLLRRCGYPVDDGRMGSISHLYLDFGISSPVSGLDWITQHLGALPLHILRSGAGFFVQLEPLESSESGITVRLGSEAALSDAMTWADPQSIAAEIVLEYAPIQGKSARTERLTATGAEDGARASALCALAAARGLSTVATIKMPSVYDVTTAGRMADLIALDRCTAGPFGVIELSDLEAMRAMLLLGPAACILTLNEEDDPQPMGLAGMRCYVRDMSCSAEGLSCNVRVLREAPP